VALREALLALASAGLLTHRRHQGYFVTKLNLAYMEQISALLEFFETDLIRTVRWPDDGEITALRVLNAKMTAAQRAGDSAAVVRFNNELHNNIFRLSPLDLFNTERERFWTLSEPYRRVHALAVSDGHAAGQHEQLIDALAARDRALCLRVTTQHRRDTLSAVLQVLSPSRPAAGAYHLADGACHCAAGDDAARLPAVAGPGAETSKLAEEEDHEH
jgi:DNA-binding GntR family transcriptional regulator